MYKEQSAGYPQELKSWLRRGEGKAEKGNADPDENRPCLSQDTAGGETKKIGTALGCVKKKRLVGHLSFRSRGVYSWRFEEVLRLVRDLN